MGKWPRPMGLLVLKSRLHLKNRQVIVRIEQRLRQVVIVGVADAADVVDSMNWMLVGADNPTVASAAFANRASAF